MIQVRTLRARMRPPSNERSPETSHEIIWITWIFGYLVLCVWVLWVRMSARISNRRLKRTHLFNMHVNRPNKFFDSFYMVMLLHRSFVRHAHHNMLSFVWWTHFVLTDSHSPASVLLNKYICYFDGVSDVSFRECVYVCLIDLTTSTWLKIWDQKYAFA